MSAPKFSSGKELEIVEYSPELKYYIKTLNYEWLEKYFQLEQSDMVSLGDPQEHIINKGGFIYYVKLNDEIVGTASLIRYPGDVYKLGKMAVTENHQGKGVGKFLLQHCISEARLKEIKKLVLYTNTLLKPAVHLYERFGFIETQLEHGHYGRANMKMELYL